MKHFLLLPAFLTTLAAREPLPVVKPLQLTDITGKSIAIPVHGKTATLLVFLSTTCPICNQYAPEINRIDNEFSGKGVATLLVQCESDLTAKDAVIHAKDYQFRPPVILDPTHKLATASGATSTPEAVVLSPDGKILYRGRIDDRFQALGKDSVNARNPDLRRALGEVLAGKPVSKPTTPAVGCVLE